MRFTGKQLAALRAVAYPESRHAFWWWSEARRRWHGPRKTLGSLIHRGLVDYDGETGHWSLTPEGEKIAMEVLPDE